MLLPVLGIGLVLGLGGGLGLGAIGSTAVTDLITVAPSG